MSYFLQNGDLFSPTPGKDAVLEALPTGNYIVVETMAGLMFKRVGNFADPGHLYGSVQKRADRILRTFLDRERSTGALLSGEKGSGKSLLARVISHTAHQMGIPTIIVNQPFCGDAFNNLLASLEQSAVVLWDEFEKVYNHEQQEAVLTLLDGMMTSKKLFVLTVNNKHGINQHMQNRPGRIFYHLEFTGLETEFVREYCEDNLNDKSQADNVLKVASMFLAFNFDMLKALVEEMNRYQEDAFDALEMLNAKPLGLSDGAPTYEVAATAPNGAKSDTRDVTALPMNLPGGVTNFYLGFDEGELGAELDEDGDGERMLSIHSKHLQALDVDAGRFEFVTDEGFRVVFQRKKREATDLRHYGTTSDI